MTTHEKALEVAYGKVALSPWSSAGEQCETFLRAYLSALLPEDVAGLVERLQSMPTCSCAGDGTEDPNPYKQAASLIQSQAARIAELEAGLREIDRHNDSPIRYDSHLNRIVDRLLNGERKG